MSSSPASPATPKVRVDVSVHVEGAENLQCKHSDFNMRVILRDITLSELLHKIGKQVNDFFSFIFCAMLLRKFVSIIKRKKQKEKVFLASSH